MVDPVEETDRPGRLDGRGLAPPVLLIVIAGVAAIVGGPDVGTATAHIEVPTPPAVVTAARLFGAYQDDAGAAHRLYGWRPLLVSGTVDRVERDLANRPIIKLSTRVQYQNAQAQVVDASELQAAALAEGGSIRLLCRGVGEYVGRPILEGCVIR